MKERGQASFVDSPTHLWNSVYHVALVDLSAKVEELDRIAASLSHAAGLGSIVVDRVDSTSLASY